MSNVSQPAPRLVASMLARSCRQAAAVHRAWGDDVMADANDHLADMLTEVAQRTQALDDQIKASEGVGS